MKLATEIALAYPALAREFAFGCLVNQFILEALEAVFRERCPCSVQDFCNFVVPVCYCLFERLVAASILYGHVGSMGNQHAGCLHMAFAACYVKGGSVIVVACVDV